MALQKKMLLATHVDRCLQWTKALLTGNPDSGMHYQISLRPPNAEHITSTMATSGWSSLMYQPQEWCRLHLQLPADDLRMPRHCLDAFSAQRHLAVPA